MVLFSLTESPSIVISDNPRHRHADWRCDRSNRGRPGLQGQKIRQGATLHVGEAHFHQTLLFQMGLCVHNSSFPSPGNAAYFFCSLTVTDLTKPGSGSIKANIGHLEGGSGLASILKCIMILENGIIPPNALFERLNTKINAKFYHLEVQTPYLSSYALRPS